MWPQNPKEFALLPQDHGVHREWSLNLLRISRNLSSVTKPSLVPDPLVMQPFPQGSAVASPDVPWESLTLFE